MHGTEEVWRQLGAWFWNSGPQCQSNWTSEFVEDSLLYKNFGRFQQTAVTKSNPFIHAHYSIQHLHAYHVRVWQYGGTMRAQ